MFGLCIFFLLIGYLFVKLIKQHRAQKFFKIRSPKLPTLPNPNFITGHANLFAYEDQNWLLIDQYHKKYGKTVGGFFGGRPTVSTVDLDFIKTYLIDESDKHINRTIFHAPLREFDVDSIMVAADDQWRRLRKAIGPAFSKHKLDAPNVQLEIQEVIDKLVGHLDRKLAEKAKLTGNDGKILVDIGDMTQKFVLSLIFSCFYKQTNRIDFDASPDKTVEIFSNIRDEFSNPLSKLCVMFPSLKPILHWLVENFHPLGKVRKEIIGHIKEQTKLNFEAKKFLKKSKHKVANEDDFLLEDGTRFRRNMIDYVIDQYHGGMINTSEYFNSSFFLLFAAFSSTSDALADICYLLAKNPEIQTKLRESIMVDGIKSEYMSWVINENLRLDPPVIVGSFRTINRDIESKEGLVPAGTLVYAPVYTINRLREYWGEDAAEFRPERWADQSNFHPVQFMTFGAGKRYCPGKNLSLLEIKSVLNSLLRRYKLHVPSNHIGPSLRCYPFFLFKRNNMPLHLEISRLNTEEVSHI